MAITIIPTYEIGGSVGDNPGAEVPYLVEGSEDESLVLSAMDTHLSQSALTHRGMPFASYTHKHVGGGCWEFQVRYGPRYQTGKAGGDGTPNGTNSGGRQQGYPSPPTPQAGDAGSVSFDTTGGQEKIFNSLRTSRNSPVGEALPPDLQGTINWNFQAGKSDGLEITVPKFVYEETWIWPIGVITGPYIATLFEQTGSTNNAAWRGFREQDVLFLGASGSQRGRDDFEIKYKFQMSLSRENFLVGDVVVTLKRGWEFMWVKTSEMRINNELIPKPVGVYVEQVYPTSNFALLGIGG